MNPMPEAAPAKADHWRRFRRLMIGMGLAGVATAILAVAAMWADGAPLKPHFIIALAGGIIIALLLAGALMGLAFVSARSGHDESVGAAEE